MNNNASLEAVLNQVWALLQRGAADTGSPLNTPTLATVAADGTPAARLIVLRRVEPKQRRLYFNTDSRSAKYRQLNHNPCGTFVFYDPEAGIQLRLLANLLAHHGDGATQAAWQELGPRGRHNYLTAEPPGSPTSEDAIRIRTEGLMQNAPPENFAYIEAQIHAVDWLEVGGDRNRRASFEWDTDNHLRASWLYP